MKSTGIIAEYNPFHNGHQYQLIQAKKMTNADITIAIMSGNFLQRGEPALLSKWARTKMALEGGIDLVFELPYAFAVHKAETFAFGAVYLLNALTCQHICFGSESGHLQAFTETIKFIKNHQEKYEAQIRKFVKQGMSYPSALASAFKQLNPHSNTVDLSKPNNILGYHYMLAAVNLNLDLQFSTVQRKGASHHETSFTNKSIASATSIRHSLLDEDVSNIQSYVPQTTFDRLIQYEQEFGQFHRWEVYWPFLQYKILSMDATQLHTIYEMEEGLENRIKNAAPLAHSFHSFMQNIKTKRYTWTRLQRICVHILTHTTKEQMRNFHTPRYARLLGMTEKGRKYLNIIKKKTQIPIVSNASSLQDEMLDLDIKAAQIYAHILKQPFRTKLVKMEYNQPPIYIKK